MGHPRDRQRFESRVQAPEIVEIVEDRAGRQSAVRGKPFPVAEALRPRVAVRP
jgi:hypothetical protein